MLATSSWSQMPLNRHTPQLSSPLSPRPSRPSRTAAQTADLTRAKSAIHRANQGQSSQAQIEKRREAFARRQRLNRESKRTELRDDDIARLEFRTQQRRWELERLKSAPPDGVRDAEDDAMTAEPETDEVAEMALLEDRELEALLELMDQRQTHDDGLAQGEVLASDEEVAYEKIFDDIAARQQQQHTSLERQGRGDTDMSG